jgi:hypothetical protein
MQVKVFLKRALTASLLSAALLGVAAAFGGADCGTSTDIAVTGVTIKDKNNSTRTISFPLHLFDDATATLTAVVSPSDATSPSISWKRSGTVVSTDATLTLSGSALAVTAHPITATVTAGGVTKTADTHAVVIHKLAAARTLYAKTTTTLYKGPGDTSGYSTAMQVTATDALTITGECGNWYYVPKVNGGDAWAFVKKADVFDPTWPLVNASGNPVFASITALDKYPSSGNEHAGSYGKWCLVDLAASVGTRVVATEAGTIDRGTVSKTGAGYNMEIIHPNGKKSRYCHLKKDTFQQSDEASVAKGAYIAQSGNTGGSTGPHLHFEISGSTSSGNSIYNTFLKPKYGSSLVFSSAMMNLGYPM